MTIMLDEKDVEIAMLSGQLERVQICLSHGIQHFSSDLSERTLARAVEYFQVALVESEPRRNLENTCLDLEIVKPHPLPQPKETVASPVRTVEELVAWAENYPQETGYFLRVIEQDFLNKAKSLGMGQDDLDQLKSLHAVRAAQESASRLSDFSTLVRVCVLQAFSEYIAKSAVTPELKRFAESYIWEYKE